MQHPVITIESDAVLNRAFQLMHSHGIHHLPVVQEQKLVGLVTAQRLRPFEHSNQRQSRRVHEVMTHHLNTLSPDTAVEEAARLIWDGEASYFLVVQDEKLRGMITTTDLLDVFITRLDDQFSSRYKRLLVPTDFSPTSREALCTALKLAQRHGATITLLHVLPRLTKLLAADIDHACAETIATIIESCEAEAVAQLSALSSSHRHCVTPRTAIGETVGMIVKTATDLKADLIVIGQSRPRPLYCLRRRLTKRVIRYAPCPVLVVNSATQYELVHDQ